MPTKKKRRAIPPADVLARVKPLLGPVVVPVLSQLERHAEMLDEIKDALELQFKRTAQIQAQRCKPRRTQISILSKA